jgi:hypothetical protein
VVMALDGPATYLAGWNNPAASPEALLF